MEEVIQLKHKFYNIVEKLKETDDYLVFSVTKKNGKKFIVRAFKSPKAYEDYFDFYKKLKTAAIDIPKIIKKDSNACMYLIEYIEGRKASEIIYKDKLSPEQMKAIFNVNAFMKAAQLELDFYPENYIFSDKKKVFYYIGHNVRTLKNDKIFLEEGIRYWLPSKEGIAHMKTLYPDYEAKAVVGAQLNKEIALLGVQYWW